MITTPELVVGTLADQDRRRAVGNRIVASAVRPDNPDERRPTTDRKPPHDRGHARSSVTPTWTRWCSCSATRAMREVDGGRVGGGRDGHPGEPRDLQTEGFDPST